MDTTILDIFNQHDAFTAIALTEAIEKVPYQPHMLGQLNIFEDNPIRTTAVSVEERQGQLKLIGFSERGTAGTQRTTELRKRRYFDVPRLFHEDTVYSNELQNIVEFGNTTVLMQLQQEVMRRLAGPTGLLANVEYTREYLRLAAIQGMVLDPKSGNPLYNWYDEFQIVQAPEVGFNLAAAAANTLRPLINAITRSMARAAQGAWVDNVSQMYAICGDAFYDAFTNHPDVIRTYVNWSDARDIRNGSQGGAFKAFEFADVVWLNYRGSDDNTTIKIPDDKVKFFPVGAPGVFREAMAPGESMEWVNQPGKKEYVLPIPDLLRRQYWGMEVYAYPLFLCTRPGMLQSGRSEA